MFRKELEAISEEDFINLLKKEGLFNKFSNQEIVCSKCGELMNLDNILSIKCKENSFLFYCNHINCYLKDASE